MTAVPSCSTCDFMRYEGQVMRCLWNPARAEVIGQAPSRIQGGPPMLVITGILPEVTLTRFCRHHPDLRVDGEVNASPGLSDAPSVPVPGNDTRQ